MFKAQDGSLKIGWWVASMVPGLIGCVFMLLCAVRQFDRHYAANYCQTFSVQTGRTTKFAQYNFWQYECLTLAKDGKWLPIANLRNLTQ